MVSENINRLLIAFGNACLEMSKAYKPNNADELNAATQATTDTAGALRNAISRAETADARIAELEALVERLIELGDVINGDKDSVWTLQTIKECWTEDVTKWEERE